MKKNNLFMILKYLVLFVFLVVFFNFYTKIDERSIFIVSWFSNIIFVNIFLDIYKKCKNYMDFGIVFLTIVILFCNGQMLLYSFGVPYSDLSIFKYSFSKVYFAAKYFLYSFLMFGLAFVLNTNNKSAERKTIETTCSSVDIAIKKFSYFCLIIFSFPFLYSKINQLMISLRYGYDSIYYGNFSSSIQFADFIGYFSNLFVISLLFLVYVYRNKKGLRKIFSLSILLLILIYFVTGMRGSALTLLISYLLIYFKFVNIKKSNKFIIISSIAILVLLFIPIIKNYRGSSSKNWSDFTSSISNSNNSAVVETISEIGGSMAPFIMTSNIIPNPFPYRYGLSYVSSFLAIIPSSIYGTSFFTDNSALDIWLMKTYNMSYGPGFSIMAESYYNFGYYGGIFFSFVIGMFISYVLNYKSKKSEYHNLNELFSITFLLMSMMIARGAFFHTPKCIIYLMMIPFFAIIQISKKNNSSEKKGGNICVQK